MPDAADLKIVVDADIQRMEAKFGQAKTLVSGFSESSMATLAKFDGTISGATKGVGSFVTALGAAGVIFAAWSATAQKAFASAGLEKEFEGMSAAATDLVSILTSDLPRGAAIAGRSVLEAFGLMERGAVGSAQQTTTAWESVLLQLRLGVDQFKGALALASGKSPSEMSARELAGAFAALQVEMEKLDRKASGTGNVFERMWQQVLGPDAATLAREIADKAANIDAVHEALRQRGRRDGGAFEDKTFDNLQKELRRRAEDVEREIELFGQLEEVKEAARRRAAIERKFEDEGREDAEMLKETLELENQRVQTLEQRLRLLKDEQKAREEAQQQNEQAARILVNGEREIQQLRDKANRLTMTARAAAELELQERLLLDLQRKGIPVTEERLAKIRELAREFGETTEAARKLQDQMRMLEETGRVISSSLEDAFRQWTRGTKIDVREMVSAMLAEFARLALVRNVLEPLLGGGLSRGGGALGNWLSSLLGIGSYSWTSEGGWQNTVIPGFAEGGRPDVGRLSIVGERGPEFFVPDVAGTIVPADMMPKGGNVTVQVVNQINAQGAYPESIADIRRELATAVAHMPGQAVAAVREAQERGALR